MMTLGERWMEKLRSRSAEAVLWLDRERKRADQIIVNIQRTIEIAGDNSKHLAVAMVLQYGEDYYTEDATMESLRGAARLVCNYCVEEGLHPRVVRVNGQTNLVVSPKELEI
ncbi:MAG: hypothetical protein HY455_01180 [Parcubacteria group bacterium]|nr:hypothetical protein [Parcubacteria group bacterium]